MVAAPSSVTLQQKRLRPMAIPETPELLAQIFAAAPDFLSAMAALIASASAFAALTPTPSDDRLLGRLYRIVDLLALNIGRAKETPPTRDRQP
ncbi:MAG: hypothetical protein AAFW46_11740 [Pseudomonadota bacterium]